MEEVERTDLSTLSLEGVAAGREEGPYTQPFVRALFNKPRTQHPHSAGRQAPGKGHVASHGKVRRSGACTQFKHAWAFNVVYRWGAQDAA